MKILIHIGRGKTGTTAIQYSLGLDRARLAEHGVLYPDAGANRKHAHHRWALAVERATGLVELKEQLKVEIEAASPSVVVLSSEVLSRLPDPIPLFEALADVGGACELVAMVRRHDSFLEAQYAQQVAAGVTRAEPAEYLDSILASEELDHERVVARWLDPLGERRLHLIPFEPEVAPVDSIALLSEVAGLPFEPPSVVRNDRLSRRAIEMLRRMPLEKRTAPLFEPLLDALREWAPADDEPAGWQHFWPRAIRQEVLERYQPANERLARRFGFAGPLFRGGPEPDGEPFPGLTVQDTIDAARHIWESGLNQRQLRSLESMARDSSEADG